MKKTLIFILSMLIGLLVISCDATNSEPEEELNTDIPTDPENLSLPSVSFDNIQPTASVTVSPLNDKRIQLNLLELRHPLTNQPIVLNYSMSNPENSNIFIAEDGIVKGLKITKASPSSVKLIDIVFAVDNSTSMEHQNDIIATNVIEFANFLVNSGLDVRFGVVGYVGRVTGAINFTNLNSLSGYLTRGWGVNRTRGFGGADSASLENNSFLYADGPDAPAGQNGIVGILFADTHFNWRTNASKVFINFTDDGIYSNGKKWNVNHLSSTLAGRASVHSVFSQDTTLIPWSNLIEKPWAMSECTGGKALFVQKNQNLYNLASLPVTQVLSNSYMVEFKKTDDAVLERVIELLIRAANADGYKQFNVTY